MTGAELIRWIQENGAEDWEVAVKAPGIEGTCEVREIWQEDGETVIGVSRPDWPADLDCPETR